MGNVPTTTSNRNLVYAVPVEGTAVPDKRTATYRSHFSPEDVLDNLLDKPCNNAWDVFQRGVEAVPDGPCLGTRERLQDGELGVFKWKTYRQIEQLALDVGSGLLTLSDAMPLLQFPEEPVVKSLRFLGLYSRNREEWVICEQACNAYALTLVPLYDTLGPASALYILSQTQLRTVVTTDDCAAKLFDMLEDLSKTDVSASSGEDNEGISGGGKEQQQQQEQKQEQQQSKEEKNLEQEEEEEKAKEGGDQQQQKQQENKTNVLDVSKKRGRLASWPPKQKNQKEKEKAHDSQGGEHSHNAASTTTTTTTTTTTPATTITTTTPPATASSSSSSTTTSAAEMTAAGSTATTATGSTVETAADQSDPSSNRINAQVDLKYVILMGDEEEAKRNSSLRDELKRRAATLGLSLLSWDDLIKLGHGNRIPRRSEYVAAPLSANTICYTSGTTGQPKGVILSHKNIIAAVAGAVRGPLKMEGMHLKAGDSYLSYLPLAHAYERVLQNILFSLGGCIGFHCGDMSKLLDDVQKLEPTVFASVPRLYTRIYDRILENVKTKSAFAQAIFNRGLSAKMQRCQVTGNTQNQFWDLVVFNKTKSLLGSRLRYMLVGSAPLEASIQEKIRALFATPLHVGYGLTETMAASFITLPGDPTAGYIGGCCPSIEFALLDIRSDMPQYRVDDAEEPAGELIVRGPVVTCGYFRNAEETARTIDSDGWLHTGDVAVLRLTDGALRIIDRKKNIFKLVQGEYVAPEKIENIYLQAPLVSQIFVFGYSTQFCLVAIVVPDADQAAKWQKERGMENLSLQQLCDEPSFYAAMEEQMAAAAKQKQLKGFEVVKKFTLTAEPFSIDNGILTPVLKIKRFFAREKFKADIDRMYAELTSSK